MPASRSSDPDGGADRIVVSADIGAPDQIAWGLSFRQLAIIAGPCGVLWAVYDRFGPLLPPAAWLPLAILVLAAAVTLALGRRDGLPLDAWIRHALTLRITPAVQAPAADPQRGGPALVGTRPKPTVVAPLRSQVTRIAADGTLDVHGTRRALLACGTTPVALRTSAEQAAVLAAFGRWLNALTGPAQIVMSAARLDLTVLADAVLSAAAAGAGDPTLRAAAADYAEFLLDLDADREPLRRQVLAVVPAGPGIDGTVRGLSALGIAVHPLDAPAAAAALAAAVNPYSPPVPGPRAAVGTPVTAAPAARAPKAPSTSRREPPDSSAPPGGSALAGIDPALARWLR